MTLGFRALIAYVIKGLLPGVILLFLSLALLSFKNTVIGLFLHSGYTSADGVNKIILFLTGGLYLFAIAAIAIGLFVNLWRYFGTHIMLDDFAFRINRGIISKDEISIPYRQIQDVDIDESILGKLVGIGKIIVLTAATTDGKHGEESEVVLDIIDIGTARELQKTLLEKSAVQLVKNA